MLKKPNDCWSTLFTPSTSNYQLNIFSSPHTSKQYFADWAIGAPYKNVEYDINDQVQSITETQYKVKTKSVDIDNFLSVNNLYSAQYASVYQSSFYEDYYYPFTGFIQPLSVTKTRYLNGNTIVNTENYTYDNYNNIKQTSTSNSRGQVISKTNYYSYDYSASTEATQLISDNVHNILYSETWNITDNTLIDAKGFGIGSFTIQPNNYLIGSSFTKKYPNYTYVLDKTSPIALSSLPGTGTSLFSLSTASAGGNIPNFHKIGVVNQYDINAIPLEVKVGEELSAAFYDYYTGSKMADLINANHNECVYTSFETKHHPGIDCQYCYTNNSESVTGAKSLDLGSGGTLVAKLNMEPSKEYIVSFWAKQGSNFNISLENASIIMTYPNQITAGQTINGWTYYSSNIQNNNGYLYLQLSGTSGYVDEFRLYPVNAGMRTYTYEPLMGISSSCNENNIITTYKYDKMGHNTLIIDHNGNVIQKNKSIIQGND